MKRSLETAESPDGRSKIDRTARWLERFLYVELALAFLLFIVEPNVMNSGTVECDAQNGNNTIGELLAWIGIGLAVTGVVTYLARLSFPNHRRWFHLAFVLLLVFVALVLVFLYISALGIGLSDTDFCS